MGEGYEIGCKYCITKNDLDKLHDDDIKPKGTMFVVRTGGGMLLFCKEQLENCYRKNDNGTKYLSSPTQDDEIDKLIYAKLENRFEFTEILGDLPYYCETCKKLHTRFYFEMKKGDEFYIPVYICKICNRQLETACPTWEKNGGGTWAAGLKKIRFKYFIFDENGNIRIKSKKTDVKIVCDNCNSEQFKIYNHFYYD